MRPTTPFQFHHLLAAETITCFHDIFLGDGTEQELHDRIHELERKIKSLEIELKQSNMARDAYDCMIDLAEKTYNIPVRKNSGAK